jgi:hypothetical protein
MERLLKEATLAWNFRNPDDKCDPFKSDWGKVCEVVHAFLRHSLSDYDAIVTSDTRDQLHEDIRSKAKAAYPWLRHDFDPRKNAGTPKVKPIFDATSAELAALFTTKQEILARLSQLRRQLPKSKTEITALESQLEWVNTQIATNTSHCKVISELSKSADEWSVRLLLTRHSKRMYLFAGQIVPIYSTLSMGYKCPRCRALVRRSRKPIPVGGGIKLYGISCCCLSTFMPAGIDWFPPEAWQTFTEKDGAFSGA